MDRDYGAEIDELREQLQALAQRIGGIPAATEAQAKGRVVKMPDMHPDPAIMAVLDQLEDSCNAHQDSGRLTYMGVFSLGGRQSTWIRNDVSANHLLSLVEDRTAERVLACIGSRDRLNLLLAILKKPRTVAQLVAECGYHSTGQVYHHLRPLIAALKRSGVAEMPTTAGMGGFFPSWPSMSLTYIVLFAVSEVASLPSPRCASSMNRNR